MKIALAADGLLNYLRQLYSFLHTIPYQLPSHIDFPLKAFLIFL